MFETLVLGLVHWASLLLLEPVYMYIVKNKFCVRLSTKNNIQAMEYLTTIPFTT